MRKIKFVARAVRWTDSNGTTHHSVRITRIKDAKVLVCPLTYGYGDHYRQTTLEKLVKEGWLPISYKDQTYMYERENKYPIEWFVTDSTKKE